MLRHDDVQQLTLSGTGGVIHLAGWRTGPDGETYNAVWSPGWEIVSEEELGTWMGLDRFRLGTEAKFMAIAHDAGGEVCAWLPGCQIKSYFPTKEPPNAGNTLNVLTGTSAKGSRR